MRRGFLSLATLTLLGAIGRAEAGENAAIWNNSNQAIDMRVTIHSSPPIVAPWYKIPPGAHYPITAPNGAAVTVDFNATPGNTLSPKFASAPVATAFVTNPLVRGAHNCFRNVTPFDVVLSPMDLRTTPGLQLGLLTAGYDPGPIDGFYGPQTISAVMAFQAANGLFVDGNAGVQTRTKLQNVLETKL